MSGPTSEEVALDFQDCLNDLQMNNRYEISNLTIIAKENIEHAQALSQTLEKHIRTTAPTRKLPALYVLDSIVKNVGSPYTIYLGRNLFSTFMEAYTLVDAKTRRSMESMFVTWKDRVPGSMEPTPVFPPETTKTIETALMKHKAVTGRTTVSRPGSTAFRNTPTPPQAASRYGLPVQVPYVNGYPSTNSTPQSVQGTPQPSAHLAQQLLSALGQPPIQDGMTKLNADIDELINSSKAEFASNPYDASTQQRLKALLDLQAITRSQQLPPQALAAIKAQVASLSSVQRPPTLSNPFNGFPQTPAWQIPTVGPAHQQPPDLSQFLQRPPSIQPQTSSQTAFAPGALEALLASATNGQKPSTPQLQQAIPNLASLPAQSAATSNGVAASSHPNNAQSLLDALRGAGLTSSTQPPQPLPTTVVPPASSGKQSAADLLKSLASIPALASLSTPLPPPGFVPPPPIFAGNKPRIPLSQASLKTFRTDLLATLYAAQPSQCPTCGHRFPATDRGKAQKAAHLDWHFRTNQRVAESAHRSVHRLWYPDEIEWVRMKEVDASVMTADDEANANAQDKKAEDAVKKRKYVVAGGAKNKSCPICQDAFVSEWNEESQDWVWNDTVDLGGRVYHEGCWEEVSRGAGGTADDPGASKGVKRKADEDPLESLKAKLRMAS